MTSLPLFFDRFEAGFFRQTGQFGFLGTISSLSGRLSPPTLLNFSLNASHFVHFSHIFLLFHDLENIVVWLSRLLILICIVLNELSFGVKHVLKGCNIYCILVFLQSLLGDPRNASFQVRCNLFERLTFNQHLIRIRLHIVHDHVLRRRFFIDLTTRTSFRYYSPIFW